MNKLNYSQNNTEASNKSQKSPFNRKRPFPQDSPPAVQNFPKISGNMINPLSPLLPILPAPAKPMTVSPQTAKVLKNGQGIKQEVVEDDEVDHDSVKVIHFEEDEENQEKIIIPKMERPTGLGGLPGNNAIDSYEKLGSGQFVSNNLIFFQFSYLLSPFEK